jgi:hypothetical protein
MARWALASAMAGRTVAEKNEQNGLIRTRHGAAAVQSGGAGRDRRHPRPCAWNARSAVARPGLGRAAVLSRRRQASTVSAAWPHEARRRQSLRWRSTCKLFIRTGKHTRAIDNAERSQDYNTRRFDAFYIYRSAGVFTNHSKGEQINSCGPGDIPFSTTDEAVWPRVGLAAAYAQSDNLRKRKPKPRRCCGSTRSSQLKDTTSLRPRHAVDITGSVVYHTHVMFHCGLTGLLGGIQHDFHPATVMPIRRAPCLKRSC